MNQQQHHRKPKKEQHRSPYNKRVGGGGGGLCDTLTCGMISFGSNRKKSMKLPYNDPVTTVSPPVGILTSILDYTKIMFLFAMRILLIIVAHYIIMGCEFISRQSNNTYQYFLLKITYYMLYVCIHIAVEWVAHEYSNCADTEIVEIKRTIEINEKRINSELSQYYMFETKNTKVASSSYGRKDHHSDDEEDGEEGYNNSGSSAYSMDDGIQSYLPEYTPNKPLKRKMNGMNNSMMQHSAEKSGTLNVINHDVIIKKAESVSSISIRSHLQHIFRYFNYVWIVGSFIAVVVHATAYLFSYHGTFLSSIVHSSSSHDYIRSHSRFLITLQLETYIGFFFVITNILIKLVIYYIYISRAIDAIKQLLQLKSISDMFIYNGAIEPHQRAEEPVFSGGDDRGETINWDNKRTYEMNIKCDDFSSLNFGTSINSNSSGNSSAFKVESPTFQSPDKNNNTFNIDTSDASHVNYSDYRSDTGIDHNITGREEISETHDTFASNGQMSSNQLAVQYLLVDSYRWVQSCCVFVALKLHFLLFYLLPTRLLFSYVNVLSMLIMGMYFGHKVTTATISTPIQMLWSSSAEDVVIPSPLPFKMFSVQRLNDAHSHVFYRNGALGYYTNDGVKIPVTLQQKIQMDIRSTHLFQCRVTNINRPSWKHTEERCVWESHNETLVYNHDDISASTSHLSTLFKSHLMKLINKHSSSSFVYGKKLPFSDNMCMWNTWSGHSNIYTKQFFSSVQHNILDIHAIDTNMLWHEKQTLYKWICEMHQEHFYEQSLNYFYINTMGAFMMILITSVFHDVRNSFSVERMSPDQLRKQINSEGSDDTESQGSSKYLRERDIGTWNITSYYISLALPNFFLTWYSPLEAILYICVLATVYTALLFYRASKRSIKN